MQAPNSAIERPGSHLSNEERAAKLTFLAVRHSQGNPRLEDFLIDQAIACHPDWNKDNYDPGLVESIFTERVIKFFDGGNHAPVDHFKIDTPRQVEGAVGHMNNGVLWREDRAGDPELDLESIACRIIWQDDKYLIEAGGRPRAKASEQMRSYFAHHALLQKPTGAWEFDGLYLAVRKYALEEMEENPCYGWVRTARAVIRAHAAAYPDDAEQLLGLIPYEAQGRNLFDELRELQAHN